MSQPSEKEKEYERPLPPEELKQLQKPTAPYYPTKLTKKNTRLVWHDVIKEDREKMNEVLKNSRNLEEVMLKCYELGKKREFRNYLDRGDY